MSSTDDNKAIARSFYEAYNGSADALQNAFDTYIAQGLLNHTNGGAMDRAAWVGADIAARSAVPDQTMTTFGQAADGDTVRTHWPSKAGTPAGTSPACPPPATPPAWSASPSMSSGADRSSSTTPSATSARSSSS